MGRKIDFSKPLAKDELAFVADRPWLRQDAELQGFEVLSESDEFLVADESGEDTSETVDETVGAAEEDGEDVVLPYEQWDYADLKAEAKTRQLSASGSKEQLIERLVQDDSANEEVEAE